MRKTASIWMFLKELVDRFFSRKNTERLAYWKNGKYHVIWRKMIHYKSTHAVDNRGEGKIDNRKSARTTAPQQNSMID